MTIDGMTDADWAAATGAGTLAPVNDDFEFDSSESTEESLRSDGIVELEGWYHFEIAKVELHLGLLDDKGKENTPHVNVTCRVLHTVPGQSPAGSVLWHRIFVASKGGEPPKQGSIDSMFRFGLGCGHLKWGKNAKGEPCPVLAETGLPKIPVRSWEKAQGLQFVAPVKRERKDPNSQYEPKLAIPMGKTYRPDHPDVAHVQKNLEALQLIGINITNPTPAAAAKGRAAYAAAAAGSNAGSASGPASSPAGKQEAAAAVTAPVEQPVRQQPQQAQFDMAGL